jgi:hypothetical protein
MHKKNDSRVPCGSIKAARQRLSLWDSSSGGMQPSSHCPTAEMEPFPKTSSSFADDGTVWRIQTFRERAGSAYKGIQLPTIT